MPEYTREQVHQILDGTLIVPSFPRQPMSDAEFERRYDPETYWQKQLIEAIQELTRAVRDLKSTEIPYLPSKPYRPSAASPTRSGAIEL